MIKKVLKSEYWKEYRLTIRKDRMENGRPVKICLTCDKPIINPKSYKADV